MEYNITLSKRLETIVSMLDENCAVIDVGTDHGYIPVYLAQNSLARKIYATDINEGPLQSAKKHAAECGLSDKIEFLLTDGLNGAEKLDINSVIIAGMGGEVIAGILGRAPWVRERGLKLILQPQSKIGFLSNWLDNEGFAINDACLAKDAGKIYTVLSVAAGKSRAPFSCAEIYADRILMQKRDPLLPEYLGILISRFTKILDGMDKASEGVSVDVYDHTRLALRGFIRMKEETEKW